MDEKLQILLGSEDFIARDNEDLFLNVNLNRTFSVYKKEKYDNDFDLAKQFEKERNLSRNFRIYGMIDSNVIDTNSIPIKVYSDSGTTNLIYQTTSSSMNFNYNINVYNKKRGKYYIPLNNYSGNSVYVKIQGNNINLATQVFENKLVFYDSDGEFVEYGTITSDLDDNLNPTEIDNNFPFFYNKHWVKSNINLIDTKLAIVNLSGVSSSVSEGNLINMIVYLDKPSPFGNEKVNLVFKGGTANNLTDFIVYENSPLNPLVGTTQLSFSPGEQYKNIYLSAVTDEIIEVIEKFDFGLDNFIQVKSGFTLDHSVEIKSVENLKYANFIISNVFENRSAFSGVFKKQNDKANFSVLPTATSPDVVPYYGYSVLRNGLYYQGAQNEFYPSDEFYLEIYNLTNQTSIIPIDSGFGNTTEEFFLPGEHRSFNVKLQYSGDTSIHEVSIKLPPSLNFVGSPASAGSIITIADLTRARLSAYRVLRNLSINDFPMIGKKNMSQLTPFLQALVTDGTQITNNYSVCYESLKKLIGGGLLDIYDTNDLYKPFVAYFTDDTFTVTLKAKAPCIRLDVNNNYLDFVGLESSKKPTITTILNYGYPTQLPFKFRLVGNVNNGNTARYGIGIKKQGYRSFSFGYDAVATPSGHDNYLVTAVSNILTNWDLYSDKPIAYSGNPFIFQDYTNNPGLTYLPRMEAYHKGLLLLNTYDKHLNSSVDNRTEYETPDVPGGATWVSDPSLINLIPRTFEKLSPTSINQETLLRIKTPNDASGIITTSYFYSFDFSNNNSTNYSTFYWKSGMNAQKLFNPSLTNTPLGIVRVSGSTISPSRLSIGISKELDIGNTGSPFISPGPVSIDYKKFKSKKTATVPYLYFPYHPFSPFGPNSIYYIPTTPSDIIDVYFKAKSPGVPFDIKNVRNIKLIGPATFSSQNVAAEIAVMPIYHNEIQGVTINPYNNKMGGFSITPP